MALFPGGTFEHGRGVFGLAILWRVSERRVFLVSLFAAAVIAVGAALVLQEFQETAAVAFSTSAARI
jgi:hypothetical protein